MVRTSFEWACASICAAAVPLIAYGRNCIDQHHVGAPWGGHSKDAAHSTGLVSHFFRQHFAHAFACNDLASANSAAHADDDVSATMISLIVDVTFMM
eukprot:SAG11_NODE_15033_length_591_cov_0.926829_1_plen_96_part_10